MALTPRRMLAGVVFIIVFIAGAGLGHSQLLVPKPVDPVVISGDDVGFRMTARKGEMPVGQLVVRVDGEWKEVEFAVGLKPVSK